MSRSAATLEVPQLSAPAEETEDLTSFFEDSITRTNAYMKVLNKVMEANHSSSSQPGWENTIIDSLELLQKHLVVNPPSYASAQILLQCLLRIEKSPRSTEAIMAIVADVIERLADMIGQKQASDKNRPPFIQEVPYSNYNLKLLSVEKGNEAEQTSGNTQHHLNKPNRPLSARYHRQSRNSRDPHAMLGFVEDVWLQVDPVGNRIVVRSSGHEDTIEETLTSITAGTLVIYKNELSWVGTNRMTSEQEVGVAIKFHDITKYTWGRIGRSPSFYLSIHAGEVFKFFPFLEEEIKEVVVAVEDLSGKEPYEEKAFVQNLLTLKLEATQNQVLRELAKMPNPWIDHTDYLYEIIDNLIAEGKPQSIFDMERLFHSCRLNEEVTKETLTAIRRSWDDATNETVRIKILTVIDRLMDRAVLRMTDSSFAHLSAWLKTQERTLDPYKSSQSLSMLERIRHKEETIKLLGIAPVAQHQFGELFDMLDEFRSFQKQYAMNEEDLF
eukprot:TRINITY_DN6309_c0_g1_i4.p1 TRINITY_DN6309_c0_g1~~TRINITY_DN6309_c0_g1_i4.p1  ORF type:complete len:498 (-),score=116.61 TRINITY_DN6309_c0_g1_i4:207-1700(-)